MDNLSGIEKKIENTIKSFEKTLKSLEIAQIECKEIAEFYPLKLDDDIGEFNRDVRCIIRAWDILKTKIRTSSKDERIERIRKLTHMQKHADKKLADIIFELKSIEDISEKFSNNENVDDNWGEDKEWENKDGDEDGGFAY